MSKTYGLYLYERGGDGDWIAGGPKCVGFYEDRDKQWLVQEAKRCSLDGIKGSKIGLVEIRVHNDDWHTPNSKSTWFIDGHKADIEYVEELLGINMQEQDRFCALVATAKKFRNEVRKLDKPLNMNEALDLKVTLLKYYDFVKNLPDEDFLDIQKVLNLDEKYCSHKNEFFELLDSKANRLVEIIERLRDDVDFRASLKGMFLLNELQEVFDNYQKINNIDFAVFGVKNPSLKLMAEAMQMSENALYELIEDPKLLYELCDKLFGDTNVCDIMWSFHSKVKWYDKIRLRDFSMKCMNNNFKVCQEMMP